MKLLRVFINCRPALASRIVGHTSALIEAIPLEDQVWVQVGTTEPDLAAAPYAEFRPGAAEWIQEGSLAAVSSRLADLIRRHRPDAVHAHGPRAAILASLARWRGAPRFNLVYEIHGAAAFETAYLRRGASSVVGFVRDYVAESAAILMSDRLVLVSDRIVAYYPVARFRPSVSIPRLVYAGRTGRTGSDSVEEVFAFAAEAQRDGRPVFVYVGSTKRWQKAEETVAFLAHAVACGASAVVFSGDREMGALVEREYTSRGEAYPAAHWFVRSLSPEDVLPALGACDVGLLLRDDVVLNRVASPTKLYEYLHSGLVIVTTAGVPEALGMGDDRVVVVDLDRLSDPDYATDAVGRALESARSRVNEPGHAGRYSWGGRGEVAAEPYLAVT